MAKQLSVALTVAVALTLALVAPVAAAAPTNDVYPGRVTISSIPFSATVDTTEATTDADDVELNDQCGAPATDASVWYEIVGTDQLLLVDVSQSDYAAGVIVATGSPGSFAVIDCAPGGLAFFAEAGVTYTILVFDFDETGNGGTLQISVAEVPPPPEVDVTVDPVGTFENSGGATISGTITCDEGAFAFIDLSASQRVGRFIVRGVGSTAIECDGTLQTWTIDVFPDTGLFKGGKVEVSVFAYACGEFDCGFDEEQVTVRLHR